MVQLHDGRVALDQDLFLEMFYNPGDWNAGSGAWKSLSILYSTIVDNYTDSHVPSVRVQQSGKYMKK